MAQYIGALDLGTTSNRFIVFDHSGRIIGSAQKEHRQIFPRSGWVEHDPLEIWNNTQEVIREALIKTGLKPAALEAVGVTNQRETTVVWEKNSGTPVYNALVWQDTRTDAICQELAREGGQDRLRSKTGLPLTTYFSGPKVKWILDTVPGARQKAEKGELLFGTIDTWVLWNLSGLHLTDVTNASRTQLMNLEGLDWDDDILSLLAIPRVMLPRICSSSEIYGEARGGLKGVVLAGDLGDQQAALFGQTCFNPGEAKNTYGTGCFLLLNTGEQAVPSSRGLLTTVGYKLGQQKAVFALEGSIAVTGSLVQWLRDNLGVIAGAAEVETLARTVEDNGGIYFVPAFSGLFAPYWRSDARGAIVGLTRFIHKGHLARAALEATAFQTGEVLEAMEEDSGVKLKALKVDGGMVFNELLMQFQADILDVPVIRPIVAETTALGAAYAAGLAVGYWKNLDELRLNWGIDKKWEPLMDEPRRRRLMVDWKKAVSRTLDWAE
ncbi:MAG: glycerol kinase GlpK [Thermodesulfobacteriota bacterium]